MRCLYAPTTARLAQSAERKALNLVVVGSSPAVGVCFILHHRCRRKVWAALAGVVPQALPRGSPFSLSLSLSLSFVALVSDASERTSLLATLAAFGRAGVCPSPAHHRSTCGIHRCRRCDPGSEFVSDANERTNWLAVVLDVGPLGFCPSSAHQWSSGRIHRCHRCDPGSIPG